MKTIEEMYNELNRAVVNRLMKGDYEFRGQDNHVVRLRVENFPVTLWMASGVDYLECYGDFGESNFLNLTFTKSEKKLLWKRFSMTAEKKKEARIKELEDELKKLKKS